MARKQDADRWCYGLGIQLFNIDTRPKMRPATTISRILRPRPSPDSRRSSIATILSNSHFDARQRKVSVSNVFNAESLLTGLRILPRFRSSGVVITQARLNCFI